MSDERGGAVARGNPDWRPDKLRVQRRAHGLTLEQAREALRNAWEWAGLTDDPPAANPQTLSQHENGEVYPGPDYRRAYCLLYQSTEPELGFRRAWPGEELPKLQLTPYDDQRNGQHVLAVERALLKITASSDEGDSYGVQQKIMDAWRRRRTGGDPHRPTLVLVGGFAGSGKTELAKFFTALTGWPLLDKDPLTRPLVEGLLVALGGDPNDRHTNLYREKVRALEYECLMQSAYANVEGGISTILSAPFIAEMASADWMARLINKCEAKGVDVSPIWVQCDPESMREYISHRSAARDSWKLRQWDDYLKTIDTELRPVVPHFVVDNRAGAAVSLADQARAAVAAAVRS
ncbi:AAA family ATPase [Kitasatospora sp. NPDC101801]|uniref:AAA family ATPase n=1 Tax=Kitasatospora sp. NPDC101801 TaxID=3364103 RepID=UPI0037F28884